MVYWNYIGDSLTFPSRTANPFATESGNSDPDSDHENPLFGVRLKRAPVRNKVQAPKTVRDRRLPMRIPHADNEFSGNEPRVSEDAHWDMDTDQNVEYLGEVLVWITLIPLCRFWGLITYT